MIGDSFDTLLDDALGATIAVGVHTANPPLKAKAASRCCPVDTGRVRTTVSGFDPAGICVSPATAIGRTKTNSITR